MLNGRQAWWRICMMKWEEILYFNRRKILLKKNCNGYPKRQLWLSKETNSVRTAISVAFEALATVSSRSIFSYVVRLMKRLTYSVAFVVGSFSIVNEKPQIINITCFQINFKLRTNIYEIQDQLMDFHHVASFSMTDATFRCNNLQQQPLQKFCRCGGSTLWYIRTLAWKRRFTL